MRSRVSTLVLLSLAGALATANADAADYLLGPQDHLRVKVYDYRPNTGEAHEWTGLIGEFTVGPSGTVSFPIVGEISAAGQSTTRLAKALSERLQEKVGLAQAPLASVEVMEFRPFYVIGLVDKPGEYEFRPGMTVLQAVGMAGGFQRLQDLALSGVQRDALALRGDVDALLSERARVKIRLARLETQVADAATFRYPLDKNASVDLQKIEAQERQVFEGARQALLAQRSILDQTKAFLRREITTLSAKGETVDRQIALAQRELGGVDTLVSRGLVTASRQIGLEQNKAQLESARFDIQLAVSHAQQDIYRADQNLRELEDKARNLQLTEMAEARGRLDALAVKISTAQAIADHAELTAMAATGAQLRAKPNFVIARIDTAGKTINISVDEGGAVRPGDTIKVDRDPATPPSRRQSALLSGLGVD